MAPQLTSYCEKVDEVSPSIVSVTESGGNSSMPWYLLASDNGNAPWTDQDVQSAIGQILGYCGSAQLAAGRYKLNRNLPLAHPLIPTLYANKVSVRGIGRPDKKGSTSIFAEAPGFPSFAQYPNWQFDVDFATRPYGVRPDSAIPTVDGGQWNVYPGAPGRPLISAQAYKYAPEWWRFCEFDVQPQNESITGIRDKSKFKNKANDATDPNNDTFPGMPRIFLPNSILRFKWYGVPLRYITSVNSVITRYRGMVNQNDWYETPDGAKKFKAGELLYLSFTPRIYTSSVMLLQNFQQGNVDFAKFCDIEFQFLYTTRNPGQDANGAADVPIPPNPNFITAGHNLNPYFPKRAFYYTVFQTNGTEYPYWLSFPFELLFTDPDANPAQAP